MDSASARNYDPGQSNHASRRYPNLIPCIVVLVLSAVIMLPVFVRGFPSGFDAVRHYRWTSQFIDALRDGAGYPQWLPTANDNQGSPATLYYPPLTFYVAAAFSLVIKNTLWALVLSCWLALAASGLTMYAFGRSLLSPRLSFAAAAMYMMVPYHLVDLYQASSVSEFWSFVWVPLLFDATRRSIAGRALEAVPYLAVSYALLILTHVPVTYLATAALGVFALVLTRKATSLLRVGAGLALGAGVGAVFLIPVLFESRHIKLFFKFSHTDYFQFENLRIALNAPWFRSDPSPYSYLLDTEVIAVALLALLLGSSLSIWKAWRSEKHDSTWTRLGLAVWIVTVFSMLMTTRLSAPLWRFVPGLSFLFFPYRWLVVASAGACLLAAFSLRLQMRGGKWRLLQMGGFLAIVLLNFALGAVMIARAPGDSGAIVEGLSRRDTREYRPAWWDGQLDRELWQASSVVQIGDADVRAIDDNGISQSYSINSSAESVILFRPLYFPGWVARVDGKQIEITPSERGHIQLTIEHGDKMLTLSFEDTWPRTAGKIVSAISLLAVLGISYWCRHREAIP